MTVLVDKSLVDADLLPDGDMRYRLLEPIRQFAFDRLIRRARISQATPTGSERGRTLGDARLASPDEVWRSSPGSEHDNRSALRWLLDQGRRAALLAVATHRDRRGSHHVEACRWFAALAAGTDARLCLTVR